MATKRQAKIDGLDEKFHAAQGELFDALRFAKSTKSDSGPGGFMGACGRAVTIARKMIALEDQLQKLGEGHENYSDGKGYAKPPRPTNNKPVHEAVAPDRGAPIRGRHMA